MGTARRLWVNPRVVLRGELSEAAVGLLAAEFAEWRLSGMLTPGFRDDFKARVRKLGGSVRRPFSEVWAHVHKAAYVIIDADGRCGLKSDRVG